MIKGWSVYMCKCEIIITFIQKEDDELYICKGLEKKRKGFVVVLL